VVALCRGRRDDHRAVADRLGVEVAAYGTGTAGLRAALRGRALPPPPAALPERRRLPSRAALGERERAVLRRMAAGDTAAEAAAVLGLRPRTVEAVQRRIVVKLGARGRAHAVAVAHRIGVLGAA
jgi:DNA-binding CsgD family transcriptional regulator